MKAKYEVTVGTHVVYSCVTTTRNTEDMLTILRERYEGHPLSIRIWQTQDGERTVIWDNLVIYQPRNKSPRKLRGKQKYTPIIDNQTGKIYKSLSQAEIHTGIFKTELKRRIEKNIPNYRYSFYQPTQKTA